MNLENDPIGVKTWGISSLQVARNKILQKDTLGKLYSYYYLLCLADNLPVARFAFWNREKHRSLSLDHGNKNMIYKRLGKNNYEIWHNGCNKTWSQCCWPALQLDIHQLELCIAGCVDTQTVWWYFARAYSQQDSHLPAMWHMWLG